MADYIWTESAGATLELVPNVISTQFGDGYSQDAASGLNALKEVWDIPHKQVPKEIADEIEAFIRPGLGWQRFNYVPLGQTVAKRFKCTSFRRTASDTPDFYDLQLRFEQVFEP